MEDKNLEKILEKLETVSKVMSTSINSIYRELVLDPDNNMLERLALDLVDARILLVSLGVDVTKVLTPNNQANLKALQDNLRLIKKEKQNKIEELESIMRNFR